MYRSILLIQFIFRFGRKYMHFGLLSIASLSLLLTPLIPEENNWPIVVLCWIGTVSCSLCFGVNYIFTKELFPTPVRYKFTKYARTFYDLTLISYLQSNCLDYLLGHFQTRINFDAIYQFTLRCIAYP